MAEKVGVVGVGLMGTTLSSRIIGAGYDVRGYDIDPARMDALKQIGGQPTDSPAGAADGVSIVVLSLPNSDVVRDVCFGPDGLAESAGKGTIVVDTTTARPEDSMQTALELQDRGIQFLDVSLSGSRDDIVALAGGDAAALELVLPVIKTFARSCHHMGPNGAGARTKLIVNCISGLNRLVMAEGLVLGMKTGVDMEKLLDVLNDSSAYSKALAHRGERMIKADYENPSSRVRQHHKDVRLILEQGQRYGSPMFLSAVHQQVLQAGEMNGLGDADNAAAIEVLRRWAGIPSEA